MPPLLPDVANRQGVDSNRLVPEGPAPAGYFLAVTGAAPFEFDWQQPPHNEILEGNGDPNGNITAPKGTLFVERDAPALWQNTDGMTTWTAVGSGGGSGFPISYDDGTYTYEITATSGHLKSDVTIDGDTDDSMVLDLDASGGSGGMVARLTLDDGFGDSSSVYVDDYEIKLAVDSSGTGSFLDLISGLAEIAYSDPGATGSPIAHIEASAAGVALIAEKFGSAVAQVTAPLNGQADISAATSVTIGILGASTVIEAQANKLGFYNATTVTKPTVTGSRGGNTALASLLTALASLGLIADSSS